MSGSEQSLLASMANALAVVAPHDQPNPIEGLPPIKKGERWPAGDPSFWRQDYDYQKPSTSKNWPKMALAARLMLGTAAEKADADSKAINLLTYEKAVSGWMGDEIGSVVYWLMHAEAVTVFYLYGSPVLKSLAREWLSVLFFWLRKAYDPKVGRVLFFGQRSCEPGRDQPGIADEFAKWLTGGPFPSCNGYDAPEGLIVGALKPVLMTAAAWPSTNPAWKTATPVMIAVGLDGITVWLGKGLNFNTPSILVGSTVGGKLQLGPAPPYQRIRQTEDGASSLQAGGLVRYSGRLVYQSVTVELPENATVYQLGVPGTVTVGSPAPAAAPPNSGPAPVPAPVIPGSAVSPGIFARFLAWLRSL